MLARRVDPALGMAGAASDAAGATAIGALASPTLAIAVTGRALHPPLAPTASTLDVWHGALLPPDDQPLLCFLARRPVDQAIKVGPRDYADCHHLDPCSGRDTPRQTLQLITAPDASAAGVGPRIRSGTDDDLVTKTHALYAAWHRHWRGGR